MIQLSLNGEEQEILAKILEGDLTRLRFEISNTESSEFRRNLHHREDVIIKALKDLGRDSPGESVSRSSPKRK
jgi:hypothetical protein